jgi:hypothetical protein
MPELDKWAEAHGLEAVIWTALGHKFRGKEVAPTVEQVIEHLRSLSGKKLENTRRYIERAPRQIDTEYRRRIEAALGWTCREN